MQILSECNLAQLVVELLNGKTVVFPTETSYGLGCDAANQAAVDKIFQIKGRVGDKPLLVVVPSVEMAKQYLVWNSTLEQLSQKYWPGSITVISKNQENKKAKKQLATGVVSKDHTVALRVTAHPLLKSITEKLGRPLVATSANISDSGDIYSVDEIVSQFKNRGHQPDIVLNYGELAKRMPTTIVSVVGDELKVLRQGEVAITNEE